ncbi:MAG: DNA-binding protein [Pseudomonadota bacterium]
MKASCEELRPVKQLVNEAPFLTEQKRRCSIFTAETNGLRIVIVKISNRLYIDRVAFADWVERHRMTPANN